MKPRFLFVAVTIVIASAVRPAVLAADTKPPPAINAVFVDSNAPDVVDIREAGAKAIERLVTEMVNEQLRAASFSGGIETAVDVGHLKRLPMTAGRVKGLPRISAVKVTSFRLRNSANAPDAAEQLALDRVLKELASDYGAPKILLQRIDGPDAKPEWRVYGPVGTAPLCLKCHGDPELQPVALREKLNAKYPTDQATGYRLGEWRGLLRVTVDSAPPPPPPSEPKAPVKSLPKKK